MYICNMAPSATWHEATSLPIVPYFVCAVHLPIFLDVYADAGTGSISRDVPRFFNVRFPRDNTILFTAELHRSIEFSHEVNVSK